MDNLSTARSPADRMEAVPFSTPFSDPRAERTSWKGTETNPKRQDADEGGLDLEQLLMSVFADEISSALNSFASLQFNRDESVKKLLVHVVDKENDTLIRRISGEKMLMMAEHMRELEELILGSEG